jgi:diadenosine tetraphosphate (Ap4A) HIT family hydrolase
MKYQDYLTTFSQDEYCPFCHFTPEELVAEGNYFSIIASRSPYSTDHLLIIPKRHVIFLKELEQAELTELRTLLTLRNAKLHQHHKAVTLLLRDCEYRQDTGKSINHLHFHLVPDRYIGIVRDSEREFLSDDDYSKEIERLKKLYQ